MEIYNHSGDLTISQFVELAKPRKLDYLTITKCNNFKVILDMSDDFLIRDTDEYLELEHSACSLSFKKDSVKRIVLHVETNEEEMTDFTEVMINLSI